MCCQARVAGIQRISRFSLHGWFSCVWEKKNSEWLHTNYLKNNVLNDKTKSDRFPKLWHHGMSCHYQTGWSLLGMSCETNGVTLRTGNHLRGMLWSHTVVLSWNDPTDDSKGKWPLFLLFPILQSYCSNYSKSLIILREGMQSWLKINFRDIRKNQKACTVPTGPRACVREEKRREGIFFSSSFRFSLC